MARYAYDRLSAQDASFLWAETPSEPMHVGALAILEAGPLRNPEGGVDIARYRRAVEAVLHWIPRYRQVLRWTPIEGWPVWVDDRLFDLSYHLRHISLPRPGTQCTTPSVLRHFRAGWTPSQRQQRSGRARSLSGGNRLLPSPGPCRLAGPARGAFSW